MYKNEYIDDMNNAQILHNLHTQRRAIHAYNTDYTLPTELFYELLETVRYAPSGYNAQPWHFLLIQNKALLQEIYEYSYHQQHILDSGNVVLVLANNEFGIDECERIIEEHRVYKHLNDMQLDSLKASMLKERSIEQKKIMSMRSTMLAAMSFLLTATAHNLATTPMMGFTEHKIKELLKIDSKYSIVLMICIGKTLEGHNEPLLPRKTAYEIATLYPL